MRLKCVLKGSIHIDSISTEGNAVTANINPYKFAQFNNMSC